MTLILPCPYGRPSARMRGRLKAVIGRRLLVAGRVLPGCGQADRNAADPIAASADSNSSPWKSRSEQRKSSILEDCDLREHDINDALALGHRNALRRDYVEEVLAAAR